MLAGQQQDVLKLAKGGLLVDWLCDIEDRESCWFDLWGVELVNAAIGIELLTSQHRQ